MFTNINAHTITCKPHYLCNTKHLYPVTYVAKNLVHSTVKPSFSCLIINGILTNNMVKFLITDFNKIHTNFGDYIEKSI